jgi:hypothetical protein
MLKKQAWCQFMLISFFILITSLQALILKSETFCLFSLIERGSVQMGS